MNMRQPRLLAASFLAVTLLLSCQILAMDTEDDSHSPFRGARGHYNDENNPFVEILADANTDAAKNTHHITLQAYQRLNDLCSGIIAQSTTHTVTKNSELFLAIRELENLVRNLRMALDRASSSATLAHKLSKNGFFLRVDQLVQVATNLYNTNPAVIITNTITRLSAVNAHNLTDEQRQIILIMLQDVNLFYNVKVVTCPHITAAEKAAFLNNLVALQAKFTQN